MTSISPKLTVYSLCYNTGRYVVEGLESFLQCDFQDYQIVVLDDCSKDDSADLVHKWLQENIKPANFIFLRHNENKGICRSLNAVLKEAKGEYFAGICDDLWESDRLDDLATLDNDPELGLVFSNAKVIDKDSKLTGKLYGSSSFLLRVDREGRYLQELYHGNYILPPTCIYRTKVLKDMGGFDEDLSFEDWDMFIRIAEKGVKMKYIDHTPVRYRQHPASYWQSRSKELFIGLLNFFEKHNLFIKSDSFVSYLEHFMYIPIRAKLNYLGWVIKEGKWKVFIPVLLNFLHFPTRIRFYAFRFLYKPKERAWSTSLS